MKLKEVSVYTSYEAFSAVENILNELGAAGLSQEVFKNDEETVVVKGYFYHEDFTAEKLELLKSKVNSLVDYDISIGRGEIIEKNLEEEDWASKWKEDIEPIRITDRIVIKPTWKDYEQQEGDVVVEIDPGMAFGTGDHGTTSGCLAMLDKYFNDKDTVLDIGTGTGVLAIAASKLGASVVKAVDIDPIAVDVAKENAILNKVEDKVEFLKGDLLEIISEKYDLVLANILPHVILRLVPDLSKVTKEGGTVILSGIIEEKVEAIKEELDKYNFEVKEVLQKEAWFTIVGNRRG